MIPGLYSWSEGQTGGNWGQDCLVNPLQGPRFAHLMKDCNILPQAVGGNKFLKQNKTFQKEVNIFLLNTDILVSKDTNDI